MVLSSEGCLVYPMTYVTAQKNFPQGWTLPVLNMSNLVVSKKKQSQTLVKEVKMDFIMH